MRGSVLHVRVLTFWMTVTLVQMSSHVNLVKRLIFREIKMNRSSEASKSRRVKYKKKDGLR